MTAENDVLATNVIVDTVLIVFVRSLPNTFLLALPESKCQLRQSTSARAHICVRSATGSGIEISDLFFSFTLLLFSCPEQLSSSIENRRNSEKEEGEEVARFWKRHLLSLQRALANTEKNSCLWPVKERLLLKWWPKKRWKRKKESTRALSAFFVTEGKRS